MKTEKELNLVKDCLVQDAIDFGYITNFVERYRKTNDSFYLDNIVWLCELSITQTNNILKELEKE
jgi:hypothetical protein